MSFEKIKKAVATLSLVAVSILSVGFATSSDANAQGRGNHRGWRNHRYSDDLIRVRRLDRDRQIRYRMQNSVRVVGYYDRFGRFHSYGYYDRFGRFHRY